MGCCHVGLIHPLDAQKIATEFTYTIARSFWQRLLGLRLSVSAQALVFPWCSSVQGFGLAREIQLVISVRRLAGSGGTRRVWRLFGEI